MGGDISDSAKLGIGVLILCFLMGIVFNLFTMTRVTTSKSSNQLQSSFNQVAESSFATYDDTTVFGSQVMNAISTYASEKISIVVSNKNDGTTMSLTSLPVASPPEGAASTDDCYYYGYALTDSFKQNGSTPYYLSKLDITPANKNNKTTGATANGQEGTFVNQTRRYDSHLIKDKTETVIGICFELRGE